MLRDPIVNPADGVRTDLLEAASLLFMTPCAHAEHVATQIGPDLHDFWVVYVSLCVTSCKFLE